MGWLRNVCLEQDASLHAHDRARPTRATCVQCRLPAKTTLVSRRIVLAQLEGSGRGALASMNPRSYEDLVGLIQEHPMTDGDAWLKMLLVKNEMLGAGMTLRCCRSLLRPGRTL